MMALCAERCSNSSGLMLWVRVAIATILMVIVVSSIGLESLLDVYLNMKMGPGVLVAGGLLVLFFLGAYNIWLILNVLYPLSFVVFLRVYSYSWAASLISPGQAGDVSIVFLMKKYNVPFRITGISYLVDKMMTLLVFTMIGWYGCSYLLPEYRRIWVVFFLGILFGLPLFLVFLRVAPVKIRFLGSIKRRINESIEDLLLLREKWHILFYNLTLTVMKWLLVSLVFSLAFRSFNVIVKWPDIGVIPILSTLVGYIPISVAGLGTVEVSATYLFGKVGVFQAAVLSAYLLLRALQYLLAIIIVIVFFWLNKSKKKKTR